MSNYLSTTILRISFGLILLAHGLLKFFVFTLAGTVGFFESLGLPGFFAYLVSFGEVALGLTLLVGLYTRLSALLSMPILLGATWVHLDNGWVFSNQGGGWEFPLLLVVIAAVIAAQGGGRFALGSPSLLDRIIPPSLQS